MVLCSPVTIWNLRGGGTPLLHNHPPPPGKAHDREGPALWVTCFYGSSVLTLGLPRTRPLSGVPQSDTGSPTSWYPSPAGHCLGKPVTRLILSCFVFLICVFSRVPPSSNGIWTEKSAKGERLHLCVSGLFAVVIKYSTCLLG